MNLFSTYSVSFSFQIDLSRYLGYLSLQVD